MENKRIGLLGATSLVGKCLLPLITQSGWRIVAFSRQPEKSSDANVEWRCISTQSNSFHSSTEVEEEKQTIPIWICSAPIWVLPDHFDFLKASGAKYVVAVSSTSRFTKEDSQDLSEQVVARKLIDAEMRFQSWADEQDIDWIIIRPTMIYGLGKDKNVAEITRLIRRWGFFPILGEGRGLRQPIYVEDVAKACVAAITKPVTRNKAYNLSGGETLSYKDMVKRIFMALDKKPRFVHIPRWSFRLALLGLHFLPRFKLWSVAMVDRMDRDLVFDHKDATAELGFSPRPFQLENRDLP